MQVTIIGGGVIGLCSAYYLQKKGHQVTVIDRSNITEGCSFGNMGYISPSHFIPLATPGIIRQGMKWMMSSSSPFYIKPRLDLDLVRWGMQFWKKSTAANVERSAPHLDNLLQLSRRLTVEMKAELPVDFDLVQKGCWMLYKNPKTGEHEKQLADQAAGFGLKTTNCTAEEVQARETQVEVDVAGGILYEDDCHLNPARFMSVLYTHLQKVGVKFWVNTDVQRVEKDGKNITRLITSQGDLLCEQLVVANGSWMEQLGKQFGLQLLMQPGKGYSMDFTGLTENLQYPSILVDDRTATSPLGNTLRIGGTMELSGHNDKILPKRVMAIYDAFKKYYPKMDLPVPTPSKAWYGYRPVTPDGMPYIGRHPKFNNVVFAGGHAMLGVSAAAGTGLLVEEIVGDKSPSIPLNAFSPDRFR
jgi:D-amino-acid dehydrogenase